MSIHMKRNLFLILFSCIIGIYSFGQLPMDVSVNVIPPYPTKYNIWIANSANYIITIHNNSDKEFDYYVRASLEGESGGEETYLRFNRDFFPSNSLTIGPHEIVTLTSVDLELLYSEAKITDLETTPNIPQEIDGELPEGTYQLCFEVMLHDPNQEIFLSPKLCSDPFFISQSNLELIYPADESVWSQTDIPITFQWINNGSQANSENFKYILRLYEIDPLLAEEEPLFEYIQSGATPFYVTDPLPDLNFVYDPNIGLPEFNKGKLYAAQVEVIDDNGSSWFDNANLSNVNTFWFGYNPYEDDNDNDNQDQQVNCFDRCNPSLPQNTVEIDDYSDVMSFDIGHFEVHVLEADSTPQGSFSGEGYITLDFLNQVKIKVTFSDIKLNNEHQALQGTIKGKIRESDRNIVDNTADILDNYVPINQDVVEQISDICQDLNTINKLSTGGWVELPFGIGQEMDGQAFTMAMIDFEGDVNGANIDFVNILDFSSLGAGFRLAMGASDVCVAPDGFGQEFTIRLLEDTNLPLDGGIRIEFAGGEYIPDYQYNIKDRQSPCHFNMDCSGFKEVTISGKVYFPETMLKADNGQGEILEGQEVKGYFSSTFERTVDQSITQDPLPRTDFIMDYYMDPFQMAKMPGWTFTLDEGSIDLSEEKNPEDIVFPPNYEGDFTVDKEWKGFYLKNISIKPPVKYTEEGQRGEGTIHHLLIDPQISVDADAYDLLPIDQGVFKGWAMSIDTFELNILQNDLLHGRIDGMIGTPVFQSGDYLEYHALVDEHDQGTDDAYYTFDGLITPNTNIDIPMAIANASICNSSYLTFQLSPIEEEQNIELFLKGDLDVNTGQFGQSISGNAHLEIADYQIKYNSVNGFILKDEVTDGTGTYIGLEDTSSVDCTDLSFVTPQEIFDAMTQEMIENGEQVFRTIFNETDLDVEQQGGGEFRDGDEMNGLPIRFKKSKLELNAGAPKLSLIVEAQLNPESIMEAGIIVTTNKIEQGKKFNFGIQNVEIYFTEGSVTLNEPVQNSSLATDTPIHVRWTPHFQDEDVLNRLRYKVMFLELTNTSLTSNLDSLFRNQSNIFYSIDDIQGTETSIDPNSPPTPFRQGSVYAVRVQATDPSGDVLNNDGYTNINTFTFGQTAIVGTNQGNNSECSERCSPALPTNTTPSSSPQSVSSFTMGNFTIEDITIEQTSGNLISGTGVAIIDFLNSVRLQVRFTDVLLNSESQALQGAVEGLESDPSLLDQVSSYLSGNMSSPVIQTLNEFMDESRMVTQVMTSGSIDLPFGIQANMATQEGSANSINIAFTDFNLTPTTSDVDFIFYLSLPSLGQGMNFGIGAQDICIAPQGFGQEMRIYLPDDLDIPIDGDLALKFNGGISNTTIDNDTISPFFLEIDCNGFKALNISGTIQFPQNILLKEDPITGEIDRTSFVKGNFSMNLEILNGGDAYIATANEAHTDLILSYTMDPFQIPGITGWGFEVSEAYLDLSEAANHTGMTFPENYDWDGTLDQEIWTGFYLKSLNLRAPADLIEGQTVRPSFGIENLLIDPQVSAVILANDILSYEDGNIKGWGFSIDEINLEILQNNLVSGGMEGQIGSPVFSEEDFLLYQAVIDRRMDTNTGDSLLMFNAVVRPQNDINLPMIVATTTVCQSSYLGFQFGKGDESTHLELFLKGNMSLDFSQYTGGSGMTGDFKLAVADFQLKYNSVHGFIMEEDVSDGSGTAIGVGLAMEDACTETEFFPDFDELTDDFNNNGDDTQRSTPNSITGNENNNQNSDNGQSTTDNSNDAPTENAMNGFPIRLGDFGIGLTNGNPEVSFTVDLALSSGGQGFAAGAGLTIYTRTNQNTGKKGIVFDHVGFDCARLAADLDFMTFIGCLCHENDNGIDGYFGRVILQAMNSILIDLQGGFATYQVNDELTYGTEDYHGLWYVDGTFASNTGIPLGPLRLNAVGGGIYWNMDAPPLPGHDDLNGSVNPDDELSAVSDCITDLAADFNLELPTGGGPLSDGAPSHMYGKRVIKVNAGLSLSDPSLLCFDPLAKVEWTDGEGIDEITVGGYLYFLQNDYFSRGASAPPPSTEGDKSTGFEANSGGSKIWISAFNSLYFYRQIDGPTLTAFRGTGSMYLNLIPNILYGSASQNDPYRLVSHDIYFGHKDHPISINNGYHLNGDGNIYWHMHLGNPYTDMGPGAATFNLAAAAGENASELGEAGLSATAYAMMGHGIPSELPPIPDMILDIIDAAGNGSPDGENNGTFDGGGVDESASREQLSDVTSGFAFGTTVTAKVGFEKIIYANLDVALGMDILLKNVAGQQCDANGQTYSPPGFNNYYGLGQSYAGLQGDIGVRGKIFNKEIDVKIMELGAAMMLQVGGPNPFWIDGRAGVYYSVLGGLLEGNARIEVVMGERCHPYPASGFSLDVIDKVYPGPDMTGDNSASPYVNPRVTFKMKVGTPDHPEAAEISIPTIDNRGREYLMTVAPVLKSFSLQKNNKGKDIPGHIEFSNTKRSVRYLIDSPLADSDQDTGNKRFKINVEIKAMEKINGKWRYITDFTSDTTVVFDAGPLPPYIDYVTHSNPIRGERYFMDSEWNNRHNSVQSNAQSRNPGLIRFRYNEKNAHFYTSDAHGLPCTYRILWKKENDGEEVSRYTLQASDISNKMVRFPIPDLEPNTLYFLQLVRTKPPRLTRTIGGGLIQQTIQQLSTSVAQNYDVAANYTISYEEDSEDDYMEVNDNETLLHMIAFKTSKYETMANKMQNATVEFVKQGTTINNLLSTAHDNIKITPADEPFEEIELLGYTERLNFPEGTSEQYYTHPRIKIIDPMKGDFYDQLVKPKMNNLLISIRSKIDEKPLGLVQQGLDPDDIIDIDLSPGQTQTFNGQNSWFPGGYGISGPHPAFRIPPPLQVDFEIDFSPSGNYFNTTNYENNEDLIYAEMSTNLNDFMESISHFSTPISQSSQTIDMMNLVFTLSSDGTFQPPQKSVYLKYLTREKTEEDVANLIEWTESKIDLIQNGSNSIMQTWSQENVNNLLSPVVSNYNSLLISPLYSGSASTVNLSGNGYSLANLSNFYGNNAFRVSDIDMYYNLNLTSINENDLIWIGSKKTLSIHD